MLLMLSFYVLASSLREAAPCPPPPLGAQVALAIDIIKKYLWSLRSLLRYFSSFYFPSEKQ